MAAAAGGDGHARQPPAQPRVVPLGHGGRVRLRGRGCVPPRAWVQGPTLPPSVQGMRACVDQPRIGLRMQLQPEICPFSVLGFRGKMTMPNAGRYHGISPVLQGFADTALSNTEIACFCNVCLMCVVHLLSLGEQLVHPWTTRHMGVTARFAPSASAMFSIPSLYP